MWHSPRSWGAFDAVQERREYSLIDSLVYPHLTRISANKSQRIAEGVNQTVRSILNAQLVKRHDLLDQIADFLNTVTLDPEEEEDDDTGSEEGESATLRGSAGARYGGLSASYLCSSAVAP